MDLQDDQDFLRDVIYGFPATQTADKPLKDCGNDGDFGFYPVHPVHRCEYLKLRGFVALCEKYFGINLCFI